MGSHNRSRALVLLALFCSGVAGLMHEVVWAKLLANLTGSTAKSHAVVLSVFMGGLAIGAVLFGRRSDKRERPLMVYVALEVAIGIYCLVLPWITEGAGFVYEQVAGAVFEQQALKVPLRLVLALSVVALPAIMMGGTLPVLARYLIAEVAQTRKQVSSLYALNNIGAVLGSGAAGFYLLPEFGIYGSLISASTLNFIAAGLVWFANSRAQHVGTVASASENSAHAGLPTYSAGQYKATLWALALSGFAAMGYEIVFLRVIALGFGSSTYSFTVMLMCFITGIGVGSAIISLVNVRRPMWWLALSQLGVIVSMVAVTPLIERLPFLVSAMRTRTLEFSSDPSISEPLRSSFEQYVSGQAGLCFVMLIIPTLLIGMGFPLVSQIQARSLSNIGGTIGSTYAWNTIGNVLGVVITSLVLLPWLGMEHSLHFNLGLNVLAAFLLVSAARETRVAPRTLAFGGGLAALIVYAMTFAGWSHTLTHSEGHLRLREGPFDGVIRSTTEGVVAAVLVREGDHVEGGAPLMSITPTPGAISPAPLSPDGRVMISAPTRGVVTALLAREQSPVSTSTKLIELQVDNDRLVRAHHPAASFEAWKRKHVLAARDWPTMFLDEDPDTNVLAVQRARSSALYVNSKGDASTGLLDMITFLLTGHIPMFLLPDAKDVMVIGHGSGVTTGGMLLHGIERLDMVEISKGVLEADKVFEWANHHCLSDPRTHIYVDDARTFLRTVPRKYDLIVSQPSNPWIAGIGSLFTVDFFEDCKARLKPGGAMIVWFHHYEQSDETIQLIIRTVHESFPHVESFLTYNSDVITLASIEPLEPDFARMEERFDVPAIRSDLGRVGVYNLATVLAYHAVSPSRFPEFIGEGPLNTDDHQRLEYKGARNMYAGRDAHLLANLGEIPLEQRPALGAEVQQLVAKVAADELKLDELRTKLAGIVAKAGAGTPEEVQAAATAPATQALREELAALERSRPARINAPYFEALPDGSTSWMYDRYVAWRAEQGAPITRSEVEIAKSATNNILTSRHRLALMIADRLANFPADGPAEPPQGAGPARGGLVPLAELQYSESFNRGVYAVYIGKTDEALAYLRHAVARAIENRDKEPFGSDSVLRLGQLLLTLPNAKTAELQARMAEIQAKASAGQMEEAQALFAATQALRDEVKELEQPQIEEVIKLLSDTIELRSQTVRIDTNVDVQLAALLLRVNRMDEATAIYTRLIETESNPVAHTRLGEMAGSIGQDYDLAQHHFERALEREPKMWEAAANLARILMIRATSGVSYAEGKQMLEYALEVVEYAQLVSPGPEARDLGDVRQQLQAMLAGAVQQPAPPPMSPPIAPVDGAPAEVRLPTSG